MPIDYQNGETVSRKTSTPSKPSFDVTKPKYTLYNMILTTQEKDAIKETLTLIQKSDLIYNTWGLKSVFPFSDGMKVNLYGPPGTGKTMAAHAIASELNRDVLIVDYSEIESKYVGETSKNLNTLFKQASDTGVVLVFDEADALLSKRVTEMHSSADVSVNQTRSVLLRLLDDYAGVCIFTTNFISNYDPAFMRRITRHIQFTYPDREQRQRLWDHYLVKELPHDADSEELASVFEGITGADIANAVLGAAIKAATKNASRIPQSFFVDSMNSIIAAKQANS